MDILEGKPVEIGIDKITPDPNQPRQHIDQEAIGELAQSIKTEGIINPIEIDLNYVIVTGERRWRAAKLNGFKTVPCKIVDISSETRFRRQVIENLHNNTMSPMDTSDAFQKLLGLPPGGRLVAGKNYGLSDLSREVGKSNEWISDLLQLQAEKGDVKKYLSKKDAKYSIIREINRRAPEEIKEPLKQKVIKGNLSDRETTAELIRALKWAPEKTRELLEEDYSGGRSAQNVVKIHAIAPEPTTIEENMRRGLGLASALLRAEEIIDKLDPSQMLPSERMKVAGIIDDLITKLTWWKNQINQVNETPLVGRIVPEPK